MTFAKVESCNPMISMNLKYCKVSTKKENINVNIAIYKGFIVTNALMK